MIIKTHGPYLFNVTPDTEILAVVRIHTDEEGARAWDKDQEEKALKTSNTVIAYLEDCIKFKKQVYHLLKELKNVEKTETPETMPDQTQQPNMEEQG